MRNYGFDILRALGLMLIILAHVNPPELLWQIRSFDVILLVAVSTLSYTEFAKPMRYWEYIIKRLKRFVLPTWVFLIILGIVFYLLKLITGIPTPFDVRTLLIAMFSFSGIGYLWILRVYIYNATFNPLIIKYENKWGRGKFLIITIFAIILYLLLENILRNNISPSLYKVCNVTILSFLAYNILAVLSYLLYRSKTKKSFLACALIALVLLADCLIKGQFNPNADKYAPRIQYMMYGLLVTGLLLVFIKSIPVKRIPKFVYFLSANSLWIYFWHIFALKMIDTYPYFSPNNILSNWWLKWAFVVIVACGITCLQNIIVAKINISRNKITRLN